VLDRFKHLGSPLAEGFDNLRAERSWDPPSDEGRNLRTEGEEGAEAEVAGRLRLIKGELMAETAKLSQGVQAVIKSEGRKGFGLWMDRSALGPEVLAEDIHRRRF